ncbi:ganglioside GM2 activator-like [Ylistrum balloti]|uniref:ganglioside GM2 activator-like n=1 Tax=Ylistrum balloti TaxID=509963 RepID=UPI0029059374|nr:ganglioside GM2 activator-like [Ylistrum balloti]
MSCLNVLTVLACALCVCNAGTFPFSDCMRTDAQRNINNIVHVNAATASPFPVVVPGPVDIVGNLDVLKNITGPLKMTLSIKRKVIGLWVPIPCISNVGSCTYPDVCSLLSSTFVKNGAVDCPVQLAAEGLPCTCPIQAGHYTLHHGHFQIPELSGVWSWLASGDYQIRATLTDAATTEVACHSMDLSIGAPCSFFDCLFG